MFQFILYSRFIWIFSAYFILHQIVAKSNKSELKYSFLQQIHRIFSNWRIEIFKMGKNWDAPKLRGGRSENSALCGFSIDLARTRPPVPLWSPLSSVLPVLVGLIPQPPHLVLKVHFTVKYEHLYICPALDFSSRTLPSSRSMHEPNIGGAVPANPIERLAPPLDFGCTRLFECVHLLSRP